MAILSPVLMPLLTRALLIAFDFSWKSVEERLYHLPLFLVEKAFSSGTLSFWNSINSNNLVGFILFILLQNRKYFEAKEEDSGAC